MIVFLQGIPCFFSNFYSYGGFATLAFYILYASLFILLANLLLFFFLKGPEKLLRQSSKLSARTDGFEGDGGDAVEAHQWKCVFTLAGNFLLFCIIL